ncbi:DNA cytosine methyltransferase [Komagataeibacter intermedius]|uniref:DNA cytosine methyltransferase n=1 Tax=Komagataeibacter intermedius TaxID=66229 RepID=UPI0009E59C4C|nr:DNA cytosine methyltransferase [Komagataeibacter intermedius]
MRVYYNEWDKSTAAWLRELGARHHLPAGHVDTRSIRDVRAGDVHDFDQCHFFAGIGGWPLALRLAGYERLPCWTGSPPCQPFSVAGQQRGKDDERHLAPVWLDLVRECRPSILFGEQVEAAIRHGWIDDLFDALEAEGYACGAAVLPACGIGAPHIRKRLFFGAVRLDDASSARHDRPLSRSESQAWDEARMCMSGEGCTTFRLADAHKGQCGRVSDGEGCQSDRTQTGWVEGDCVAQSHRQPDGAAHSDNPRPQRRQGVPECADEQPSGARGMEGGPADPHHSFWSNADWIGCRDGKFRPVEPGILPLADGFPSRVGLLRGAGNAIVPQVAAAFIQEFIGAFAEIQENTGG